MTRGRNGKTPPPDINPAVLAELFPDNDNDTSFAFDLASSASFGRLCASVAAVGGMATVFIDSGDNSLCISIRLGGRKRGYRFSGDDGDDIVLDQLANFYHGAYAKHIRKDAPAKGK